MSWAGKTSLQALFRSLFPQKGQAPSSLAPGRQQGQTLSPEECARVQDLVDAWVKGKGYRLPLRTLHDAAPRIGVPPVILHRYFRQVKGCDFRSWRMRLRIEDAKVQLLQEPDTPASTIARRLGMLDRSNFMRQFQACTGVSPEQWRRQAKA